MHREHAPILVWAAFRRLLSCAMLELVGLLFAEFWPLWHVGLRMMMRGQCSIVWVAIKEFNLKRHSKDINMYIYIYIHIDICMFTYMCVCIYVRVYYIHICIYVYVCIHIYMYIYIYIYAYMYMHMYM